MQLHLSVMYEIEAKIYREREDILVFTQDNSTTPENIKAALFEAETLFGHQSDGAHYVLLRIIVQH